MEDINNLKNNIIKELILDVEYAEFLCRQNLCDADMIDLICCAPVPLTRKGEMLKNLSAYQGKTEKRFSYNTYYDVIQKALAALQLEDNEILLCVGHTREHGEDTQFESFPSRSAEKICEYIKSEYEFDKETCDFWYEIEKWHNRKEGEIDKHFDVQTSMVDDYTFTLINGEICYFCNFNEKQELSYEDEEIIDKFSLFYSGNDLNLPTPYKEGDILEVNSSPFSPKTKVVVIATSDYCDCCLPCCLYLTENGANAGALKHSHIYQNTPSENISPLYSVKRFTGELTEKESILKAVSDYVKGDREKGDKIFEIVTNDEKTEDSNYEALRKIIK